MAGPLPFPLKDQDVPILGQQFELQQWYPTVIITCKCGEKPTVVAIIGTGDSKCRTCGRTYRLQELDYNREKSDVHINIGHSAPPH